MARLPSAPYCLVAAAGWRDGRRRGERERGRDEGGSALICCYIRKITFLLMYPSGRLLYLVVCSVDLFVFEDILYKPSEISV